MKGESRMKEQTERKRILAINDLSGHSQTSLMSVIPILNTMGIAVTALPTAILSSNTEQKGFQLVELTNYLNSFLSQWSGLKLKFNAIYSGFLSSEHQVEIVIKAIGMFKQKEQLIIVDPVMADDGELYSCFDSNIIESMQKLIAYADVITPNLTEAALLVGQPYQAELELRTVKAWCRKLAEQGPKQVVITSVPVKNDKAKTSVICYNKLSDRFDKITCAYLPVNYPGTGDIFTSVMTGYLLNGIELEQAIRKAVRFVSKAIGLTMQMKTPAKEGICLEQSIYLLRK